MPQKRHASDGGESGVCKKPCISVNGLQEDLRQIALLLKHCHGMSDEEKSEMQEELAHFTEVGCAAVDVYNGRVHRLNLYDRGITRCSVLKFPPQLRILNLGNNVLGWYKDVSRLLLPHSLEVLYINNNPLRDFVRELKLPPTLRMLDISKCETYNDLEYLRLPKSLKHLDIHGNDLTCEGLNAIFAQNKLCELKTLVVSWKGSSNVSLPNTLEELDMSNSAAGYRHFKFPLLLRKLNMSYNSLTMGDVLCVQFPQCLKELDLSGNELDTLGGVKNEGTRYLQLPPRLEKLDMSRNDMTVATFSYVRFPKQLQSLNLHDNNLDRRCVCYLNWLPNLEHLDISSNLLSTEAILDLHLFPRLCTLILRNNHIVKSPSLFSWALPPGLKTFDLDLNPYLEGVCPLELGEALLRRSKSAQGKRDYQLKKYQQEHELRFWICLGLMRRRYMALTEDGNSDKIVIFLSKNYGSKNIRQLMLQYFTVFA